MKTAQVTATTIYTFYYDPESTEFKAAIEDFRACMSADATEEDMIENAAHQLRLRGGVDTMFEGIGWLKKKKVAEATEEPYSGIEVDCEDPSFQYDFEEYIEREE